MHRPSLRLILIIVGCLVAIGVPLGWSLADHPSGDEQLNPGAAVALAQSTAPPSTTKAQPPVPRTTTVAPRPKTTPPKTTQPPRAAAPAANFPAGAATTPVGLAIPSLSIKAPIVAVGVDATGEMAIPESISTVGWYKWGPGPGAAQGSIVMSGHVDSARDGLGAFFQLRTISTGATVSVTLGGGAVRTYRVIAREEFPKTNVPLAKLFARDGPERLTLITCGGSFNRQAGSYYDNIVVTAVPA